MLLLQIKQQEKAFWCLVFLLHRNNWRQIYNHNTPKLLNLLGLVEDRLKKENKTLYDHFIDQDLSMVAAFSPFFITCFIYRVPLDIATRIFETFIVEGETALVKIIFKMLYHKKDKIMSLTDIDLLEYLRSGIIVECIEELSIDQLINY